MNTPIAIAEAKNELVRIDGLLTSPLLLIGGLAVNQYIHSRNSEDIDLVCLHEKASELVSCLFPLDAWEVENKTGDEYRPSYVMVNRNDPRVMIKFGPKIEEREPYKYIDWKRISDKTVKFKYRNSDLNNILVPSPSSLAFMKLLAYHERKNGKELQDLKDFSDLSNHEKFSLVHFVSIISSTGATNHIQEIIKKVKYNKIFMSSSIYRLSVLFEASISASMSAPISKKEQSASFSSTPTDNINNNIPSYALDKENAKSEGYEIEATRIIGTIEPEDTHIRNSMSDFHEKNQNNIEEIYLQCSKTLNLFDKAIYITLIGTDFVLCPSRYRAFIVTGSPGKISKNFKDIDAGTLIEYHNFEIRVLSVSSGDATFAVSTISSQRQNEQFLNNMKAIDEILGNLKNDFLHIYTCKNNNINGEFLYYMDSGTKKNLEIIISADLIKIDKKFSEMRNNENIMYHIKLSETGRQYGRYLSTISSKIIPQGPSTVDL